MSAIAVIPGRIEVDTPARRPGPWVTDPAQVHTTVRIEGELDAVVLPEFRNALALALRTGAHLVVVDLRNSRFLSIGNAAVLICAAADAAAGGVDLRVVAGRREVERVLTMTGARGLLNSYPTLDAAQDSECDQSNAEMVR